MECRSTSEKRRSTPWASTRKKMCGESKKFCARRDPACPVALPAETRPAASPREFRYASGNPGAFCYWQQFQCDLTQASAAATRFAIAGCEWRSHSTQREGVFSARFCSANLFIAEMKGSTLATDWKQ